jgi:integrase
VAAQSTFTGPEDAVFVSGTGRPVDAHNLSNRVLRPVGAKLGMPWLGWHVFRHTFASWARQEALSPADQMASLGHGDIRMTMQYGEQDLDRRRGVVGKLAAKLSPKKPAAKAMAMAGAN